MKKLLAILLLLALCFPIAMAGTNFMDNKNSATYGGLIYEGEFIPNSSASLVCTAPQTVYLAVENESVVYYFNEYPNDAVVGHRIVVNFPSAPPAVPTGHTNYNWTQSFRCQNPDSMYYSTWYTIGAGARPPNVTVMFSISDSSNFTAKLQGVSVVTSSGASGTTDVNGSVSLVISPVGSGYTYSLTKTGYTTVNGASLGGYGETGGTLYTTMTSAVITTPVPTPTLPPVPAGLVRTIVIVQHATAGSPIYGATLNLRDVESNTWKNGTTSQYTSTYIDTLPSHTIDVYGSAVGYSSTQETGAAIGGTYRLPLYPLILPAGTGNVNVAFNVYDENGMSLSGVTITTRLTTTGASSVDVTGSGGGVVVVLPNSTTFSITAKKAGYQNYASSLTTPAFADSQVRITISHDYIPIPTATPIGYTTVPTYAPNCNPASIDYDAKLCSASKTSDLMLLIQNNAPTIVELSIYVVIISLLGMFVAVIFNFGK
jgi:hypothetical protein